MPNYTGHCTSDLQALTGAHSVIFIFLVTYHCVYIYLVAMTLKKRRKAESEVTELKLLRFSLGITRRNRIRNGYSRLNGLA